MMPKTSQPDGDSGSLHEMSSLQEVSSTLLQGDFPLFHSALQCPSKYLCKSFKVNKDGSMSHQRSNKTRKREYYIGNDTKLGYWAPVLRISFMTWSCKREVDKTQYKRSLKKAPIG